MTDNYKYYDRDHIILKYLEHKGYDVNSIESIIPRFKLPRINDDDTDEIDGFRVKARIIEYQSENKRWITPAISVEHSKVIIIDYEKYTQFKRDKNLEEILKD